MEAAIIAARSIDRARQQHVRAFRVGPGQYRSHSRSDKHTWYDVTARCVGGRVVVECACPGGTYLKDEFGNSLDKHAVAVAKRLMRLPAELAEVAA